MHSTIVEKYLFFYIYAKYLKIINDDMIGQKTELV